MPVSLVALVANTPNSFSTNSAKVEMTELSPSDYQLGPAFTKELSLFGKDNKAEKLRVMQRTSLFNKNFKVD